MARELYSDLNSLGFCDDQGVIKESDEPPMIKYNFDFDTKMRIELAKDLLRRRSFEVQESSIAPEVFENQYEIVA